MKQLGLASTILIVGILMPYESNSLENGSIIPSNNLALSNVQIAAVIDSLQFAIPTSNSIQQQTANYKLSKANNFNRNSSSNSSNTIIF